MAQSIQGIPDDVVAQIQKIFRLAAKTPNEAEAAAALAKGNELLERYNLDLVSVSEANVGSGARERMAVVGGFRKWERDLWEAVAALNFCLYWHQRAWKERYEFGKWRNWKHEHYLVGRKVNIAATQAMASYLMDVVARLSRERTRGENTAQGLDSWANSYRHGLVARICRKLRERRNAALREEEARREAEMRAADGAVATSTAVTLQVYIDKETDANYDFEFGEGWSAARAAERAQAAAIRRMSEDEYTRWATEHPAEAAEIAARRRRQARRQRSGGGDRNMDSGAYWVGYSDGEKVSIDPQVDTGRRKLLQRR